MREKRKCLLLFSLFYLYAHFTTMLTSGQDFDDVLVSVMWEDMKRLLELTHEFDRSGVSNLSSGIFNAFPKMIIDMNTTVRIEPTQQEIFNYAALTNNERKEKGLEPVQVWIKTEMRSQENKTIFPVNSAVLLAQQPNLISPGTIAGFILVAPFEMDHLDTFAVLEEEAEIVNRVLSSSDLLLWIIATVGTKCTTERTSTFPYSKFSFEVYDHSLHQECPSPPYGNKTWMHHVDECLKLRESFTPLMSPKMVITSVEERLEMFYFPHSGKGHIGPYYKNLTNFLTLRHRMMTNCEIYIIPEVIVFSIPPPPIDLNQTKLDRNHVGFSLYFDLLPQNVTALIQEILRTASKITITNFFNLTNESVAEINSTVYEIVIFKQRIEGGSEFAEIDNVPIEVSILLDRFEERSNANQMPYLDVLDRVFENAVTMNKAWVKIISTIVITGYKTEYVWQEMLSHLEFLEEAYPDQAVYGPEFGFTVNVHHCNSANVANRVEELKNSSVNIQIWPEDKLSLYNSTPEYIIGLLVSYPSNALDRLENCKNTFREEGLTSENFFFYATIVSCIKIAYFSTWGGEEAHIKLVRLLNDLVVSSGNFLTMHSALESSKYQTSHPGIPTFSFFCNASDATKIPECAKTQICGWWRVYENDDLHVMPVIKNKIKFLRDLLDDDITTVPGPISSSTKDSELQSTSFYTSTEFYVSTSAYLTDESSIGTIATSATPSSKQISDIQLTILLVLVVIGVLLVAIASVHIWFRYRQIQILSNSEIQEFYDGNPNKTPITGTDVACSMKYNKSVYEIARSSFEIDTTRYIGSGEFAIVYPGTMINANVHVAIKTLKKRSKRLDQSAVPSLRGLLSEIKILSFLGAHQNIVMFYGANTDKLQSGNIYVILEMCSFGCLATYLRNLKNKGNGDCNSDAVSSTRSLFGISEEDECIHEYDFHPKIKDKKMQDDLYKWSKDIACGMEYIATKKLVHADLATRNVLLDANKTAKIADFGLSRRLYDYTHYLKTSHEPLPWRWMAPEALKRLEFCEKTDVWAYGITLWEIYMLGDTPYPGLSWDVNFPNMLVDGLTPGMPTYDDRKMYAIMKQCWGINPELRPTFLELVEKINNAFENQNLEGYVAVW